MNRHATLLLLSLTLSIVGASIAVDRLAEAEDEPLAEALDAEDDVTIPADNLETPYVDDLIPSDSFPAPWTFGTLFDPPISGYPGHERIHRAVYLGRLWMRGEYLAWSMSGTHLPPLLAGSDVVGPGLPADPGDVDTEPLFGDFDAHDELRSGGRYRAGFWFTPAHISSVEAGFFGIDGHDIRRQASGLDIPVITRPFVNAQTGLEDAVFVSYPDLQLGASVVESDVEVFGADVVLRHMLRGGERSRIDIMAGYRYLRLWDQLSIRDAFVSLNDGSGFETGSLVDRRDLFRSENQFHGGDLGLIGRLWNYRWAAEAMGRVAFGGTGTASRVDGWTVATQEILGGDPVVTSADGAVLAQPSNMGNFTQSNFAAVAELGLRLEFAFSHQCRATAGYTLMWWSSVARVTDSIDAMVDDSQIPPNTNPNAVRPEFRFQNRDFWMQGLSVGLQYDF
ncbi:MAG: BBP7 family outer membrane beta-barrel protein [Planctomycetes bacterium]|nr:BBP7 family outer membrane beta-barrel protein [Planctomycetota bacterium]